MSGQELLYLVKDRRGVAHPKEVIVAGKLDVSGSGDVLGEIPAVPNTNRDVARAVQDEGRNATLASTSRTSVSAFIFISDRYAPGLVARRSYAAHLRRKSTSSATEGAKTSTVLPLPQLSTFASTNLSNASGG